MRRRSSGRGTSFNVGKRINTNLTIPPPRQLSEAELLNKCCEDSDVYYSDLWRNKCDGTKLSYSSNNCSKYRNELLLKKNTENVRDTGENLKNIRDISAIKNYCKDNFLVDDHCKLFCENSDDKCEDLYFNHCIADSNYENDVECQKNELISKKVDLCCDTIDNTDCGNYTYDSDFCQTNRINTAFSYNGYDDKILEDNKKLLNRYCDSGDNLITDDRCKNYCNRGNKPCSYIQKKYCEKTINEKSDYCKEVCSSNYVGKTPPELLPNGIESNILWEMCQKQAENNMDVIRRGMPSVIQIQTGMVEIYLNESDIYNADAKPTYLKLDYMLKSKIYNKNNVIWLYFYVKADETKLYHFVADINKYMKINIWVDNTEIKYPLLSDESNPAKQYFNFKGDKWYPIKVKLESTIKRVSFNEYDFDFKLNWGIKTTGHFPIIEQNFGIINTDDTKDAINKKLYIINNTEYPKLIKEKILIISYKTREIKGLPIKKELISNINIVNYRPEGFTNNYSMKLLFFLIPKYSENYTVYLEHNKAHKTRLTINNVEIKLSPYNNGSTFNIDFNSNTSYKCMIEQNISSGNQKLILYWKSKTQQARIIQSDAFAILQPNVETRIEPEVIPQYQIDYTNNDNCCLNEGDSNLCKDDYQKGNNLCISHLSDYCLNSNMNDKCVSYCKDIDNDCGKINYEYCKKNVNDPLCEDICDYTLDNQFVNDVCHKTAKYLMKVADQIKSDAEIKAQIEAERRDRELRAQQKLILERQMRNQKRDEYEKELLQRALEEQLEREKILKQEREAANNYTNNLEQALDAYKKYLEELKLKTEAERDKRAASMLRQRKFEEAQRILKFNKFSADLQKMDTEQIQHAINKAKVYDLLTTTYNIEDVEISNITNLPLDLVQDISAELIYDDKIELAEDPEIIEERNKEIIPLAVEAAKKAEDDVRNNPLTYQEVLDEIKQAKEDAEKLEFSKEVINELVVNAKEAADKKVQELINNGITDEDILNKVSLDTELEAIQLGLTADELKDIEKKAIEKSNKYAEERRKKIEKELNFEFPEDPVFDDRDLDADLDTLVPFILNNLDKSLSEISEETKVPLDRIYDLEADIKKRIDKYVQQDISEGFISISKKEKQYIYNEFKKKLNDKFEGYTNNSLFSIGNIFIVFLVLIVMILIGVNIYKYIKSTDNTKLIIKKI